METAKDIAGFDQFRAIACVALGALAGGLVGVPLIGDGAAWFVPLFAVAGAVAGYRRRRSTAFLYVCLVTVLVLSTLISFHTVTPQ